MGLLRRLLVALVLALLVLGGGTWWALESGGVAIVETRDEAGQPRRTHVWFVEREGVLWLEAGTPENPWFVDVGRDPRLGFQSDGRVGRFVARAVPEQSRAVRDALSAKYGLRDRWVGLFVDASRSVAVRLDPSVEGP